MQKNTQYFLVTIFVIGLIAGLIGGVISAQLFLQPGPQGEQGVQGEPGPQGEAGSQGLPGVNGTDAILQITQVSNDTEVDTSGYPAMQWLNMSAFDASMAVTLTIQQNSKLWVQFSAAHELEPPAALWIRLVIDNILNSSKYACSVGPPASGVYQMSGHLDFLTGALNAGTHTITVQFLRVNGSPLIIDRTLTIIELLSD